MSAVKVKADDWEKAAGIFDEVYREFQRQEPNPTPVPLCEGKVIRFDSPGDGLEDNITIYNLQPDGSINEDDYDDACYPYDGKLGIGRFIGKMAKRIAEARGQAGQD